MISTKRLVATLIATIAIVGLSCTQAHAEDAPTDTVLIFGDSITEKPTATGAPYNDTVGSPLRGWWSWVAADIHMTPVTRAIYGSGMLKRASCTKPASSTNSLFIERLPEIAAVKPDVIIVEGGRNDYRVCKSGKAVTASKTQITAAVRKYLHDLALAASANGMSRKNVYVFTPWGTKLSTQRKVIQPIVAKWSTYYGLAPISVSYLSDTYTTDGTHPNAKGSEELYKRVMKSNLSTNRE